MRYLMKIYLIFLHRICNKTDEYGRVAEVKRKKTAKINSVAGLLTQAIGIFVSFISRRVFLHTLGMVYLGVNSTLTQVLGALSISELGIQTVVVYKLYAPVVNKDHKRIGEVMGVFRMLYRWTALIIFTGGVLAIPFMKYIITDVDISLKKIYVMWMLMTVTSAVSYILSYNTALFCADQKQYFISIINSVTNVLFSVLNIILLITCKNIYIYLLINMMRTITLNAVVFLFRRKRYAWLKMEKVEKETCKEILLNAKDVFAGKLIGQ